MSKAKTMRLGTRSSLLAMAQSRFVATELKHRNPELDLELVEFNTRGDLDRTTPLQTIDDPDFFSAELDNALIAGEIDFCVHSYKDLGSERPGRLHLAALPKRENPADVIVFREDIVDRLRTANVSLCIGSCSLRRQLNTADFLAHALPNFGNTIDVQFEPLRGNVPDRLRRTLANASDQLDGVVLALAGLQRLWNDTDGRADIEKILHKARYMLLPLSECPTAAGQGALAIECRADDQATRAILRSIHDPETEMLLKLEQQLLDQVLTKHPLTADHCGTSAIPDATLEYVARLRGKNTEENQSPIYAALTGVQPEKPQHARPWSGSEWQCHSQQRPIEMDLPTSGHVFVAHAHALANQQLDPKVHCWTSGVSSWFKLAKRGIWVDGCLDNLGFSTLPDWISNSVLQLPPLQDWTALTHLTAAPGWRNSGVGAVLATYESIGATANNSFDSSALASSTHFFWLSPQQFQTFRHLVPDNAHHACGPGKTLANLRAAGVDNVVPFPSHREWRQWLS